MLRTAADGMTPKTDPEAQRIKARKARKANDRALTKQIGFLGLVTLHLRTALAARAAPIEEDCPLCARLQRDAATRRTVNEHRIAGVAVA